MAMPTDVPIIDCMISFPIEDKKKLYEFITKQTKDSQSKDEFEFPVEYMFKDVPDEHDSSEDPVAVTLREMDKHNIEKGLIGIGSENSQRALTQHPDRFVAALSVDPNDIMGSLGRIVEAHEKYDIRAVDVFPCGLFPQIAINAPQMYPIYAKCCELGIPCGSTPASPVPGSSSTRSSVDYIDDVMYDFPDLVFVTRHGCEPWEELAVKLMLKWPGLHYCTSAFAPKHYPKAIIDYANTRGADKIIYAGYFPMGLTLDRIMGDMVERAVPRPRLAEVPAGERGAGPQAQVSSEGGTTLRYRDEERLTPEQRAALCGPGAMFERTTEVVLGAEVEVFVQRPRSLVEVLRSSAEQFGDRPYLVFPDLGSGGATVTFAEVPERVGAIAAVLADEYGVGRGDRVAFASANSLDYALAQLAVVSLGAIIVGLNGWWTGPELAYGMEITTPTVLFGDEARLQRLAEVGIEGMPMLSVDGKAPLPDVDIDEDDPFMILFTSGTTGRPKGATLTHRNMVHMGSAMAFGRAVTMLVNGIAPPPPDAPPPASICATPFFHISGTAPLFMTGARFGSSLVFPPPGRWDPAVHLRLTADHRVSAWSGVPTQFWRMLEHPDFESYDLSSSDHGVVGWRAVPSRAHARPEREDPHRQPVERVRHERVDGRGHPPVGRALLHPPRVGGCAVPHARGPDPRRRPQRAARKARSARSACTARSCSRGTGTTPTRPPRCSTTSAGTTAATTGASRTACSGSRAGCAT